MAYLYSTVSGLLSVLWFGWRDGAFLGGTLAAAVMCTQWVYRKSESASLAFGVIFSAVSLTGWLLWSFDERARVQAAGYRPLGDLHAPSDLAVALSGGGFRAALFHAGVVDQLTQYGMRPGVFSGVSGGAIAAAFFANGGESEDFLVRFGKGQFNVAREALTIFSLPRLIMSTRLPVLDLQLWPTGYSRTALLADHLDRAFLHGMRFVNSRGRPLIVGVTDTSRGEAVGVWRGGTLAIPIRSLPNRLGVATLQIDPEERAFKWIHRTRSGTLEADLASLRHERISTLVAASGAFPMAFNALRWGQRRFVDGGVADNTGLALLLEARRLASESGDEPLQFNRLVVSDGGAAVIGLANESLTAWIDTMHRLTGPENLITSASVPPLKQTVVSGAGLVEAWFGPSIARQMALADGDRVPDSLIFRGVVESTGTLRQLIRMCLETKCSSALDMGHEDIEGLLSFLDDRERTCAKELWRLKGTDRSVGSQNLGTLS